MSELDLESLRLEINEIDRQLVSLFGRRMEVVADVAAYKQAHHLPIFHPQREKQVIEQVRAQLPEEQKSYGEAMFRNLMDLSKNYQSLRLHRQAFTDWLEAQPCRSQPLPDAPVCCFGSRGSYSGAAATALFPNAALCYLPSFSAVFEAIESGDAVYGVVPIENSNAGSVHEIYDLLMEHRCYITASIVCGIHHCLLAEPGTRLEAVRTVRSHPQALKQCANYLNTLGVQTEPAESTSEAARQLALHPDPAAAAIGSKENAELYGLEVLCPCIPVESANMTRFICVSKQPEISPDANRISLCLSLEHQTGSLYRILSHFALSGLNLTKIESRPLKSGRFEYLFYLDFEGNIGTPEVQHTLNALSGELEQLLFLGNYPVYQQP